MTTLQQMNFSKMLRDADLKTKRVKCWCCSNSKADGYDYDTNTCGDVDVDEEFRLICITGEATFECVYCFMDNHWGSVGEFGNRSDYDSDHCVQRETRDLSFCDPRDYDYLPTYLHRELTILDPRLRAETTQGNGNDQLE
jgi:hypothetical protein